ncbi:MAG: hypothetical protein ABI768_14225 [Acidobacteriota bacterium]
MSPLGIRLASSVALFLTAGVLAGAGPPIDPRTDSEGRAARPAPAVQAFAVDPDASDTNRMPANPEGRAAFAAGRTAETIVPNLFSYTRSLGIQYTPRTSGQTYAYPGGGCAYQTTATGGDYITPLNVPDGAILKYLRIYFYDTTATDLVAWIVRYDQAGNTVDLTSVSSSGAAGYGTTLSPTITEVVDTALYSYGLVWRPNVYTSAQQFCGARVAYYWPADGHFTAIPPCRMVDTRAPAFPAPLGGGWLPAATVRSYTLTNVCNLPTGAKAVSVNATVTGPSGPGFLTLWPEGGAFPPVSTLNFLGGDTIVNSAIVPLSATGSISMALGVSGGHVILDINGYYY